MVPLDGGGGGGEGGSPSRWSTLRRSVNQRTLGARHQLEVVSTSLGVESGDTSTPTGSQESLQSHQSQSPVNDRSHHSGSSLWGVSGGMIGGGGSTPRVQSNVVGGDKQLPPPTPEAAVSNKNLPSFPKLKLLTRRYSTRVPPQKKWERTTTQRITKTSLPCLYMRRSLFAAMVG